MGLMVGAYAAEPADAVERRKMYEQLGALSWCSGVELPVHADAAVDWPAGARDDWEVVVTAIPGTMQRMLRDPLFGLASTDEDGRRRAVAFTRQVYDGVQRLRESGPRLLALELHSAPRGGGDAAALAASLAEITGWDWAGAAVVVEHCDALVPGQAPEKGFLALADEIAALQPLSSAQVGVAVNWARSAIEGRGADLPRQHISEAREAGLLRGLMFSSCAGRPTGFGPAWVDAHLPAHGVDETPTASLLTRRLVADALQAAGSGLTYTGFKIGLGSSSLNAEETVHRLDQMARLCGA